MRGFRAALALTGVALFLAAAGVGAAKESTPLLGFVPIGPESWSLARLNPLTLTPRKGRTLRLDDAISAYRTTQDTNPDVYKSTYVLPEAAGPGGERKNVGEPTVFAIWKFGKNPVAAKELITYLADHQVEAMTASRGFNMPFLRAQYKKPMPVIGEDPKLSPMQDIEKITAFFGYPGPMSPPAQEVVTTFVIPDMFTRVARGQNIDETVEWGVGEIRRIYAKYKAA